MSSHRFHGRYRVESTRLPGWDYAQPGWYFVTVCVADRVGMPLGRVMNGTMQWSVAGSIVAEEWCKTGIVRPNVRLDEWVVMPDHLHGIIVIDGGNPPVNLPSWKPGTLGAIINQFKSMCTKRIHAVGVPFAWQPRFYDRVIRHPQELVRVQEYIRANPEQWGREAEESAGHF